MSRARSRLVLGHLLLLGGGTLIGWLYGRADLGLLLAALAGLGWQLRQLLRFELALRTNDFGHLRYGNGIWSQIYSRIRYLRNRSKLHKKRHRQLLKEIRKSANALPDGGIVLNENFDVILCNSAAQKMVGFRPRQDRGQRVDNIIRAPAFHRYLSSGKFDAAVEIPSPVGDGGWLSCRIVPYGAMQRLLLVRDITEQRRMSVLRREFVGNASHELRSPLTVISGYLDTLVTERDVPDEWRAPLEQMRVQANRMNNIVTELLELSRLEGAGPAPADEIVDVSGLLFAARKMQAGRKDAPRIELVIDTQARLLGSSAEIESVIDNLLSNAIRYSPPDGVITLNWSGDDDGASLVVSDVGIGIEPEHISRLTERFFRVDPGRDRQDGGVGLGLAIVKHVLERHSATLEIFSEPQKGSQFTCHFPRERIVIPQPLPLAPDTRTG